MKKLCLVVPCYNEEEVLETTAGLLIKKMNALINQGVIDPDSKVLLVNDGSKDKTWEIIKALNVNEPIINGLKLSRNKGHQNALLAGLMTVKDSFDVTISLDADLQDDINAIDAMLAAYDHGCEIVYGVRSKREKDSFFKRLTAEGFYTVMKHLGVDIVFNHADYRLLSNKALNALEDFKEVNLFLRGIIPLIGFKTTTVEYERSERFAGESKYPLKKMIEFALDGITSFSVRPLRFITLFGFIIFLVSILMSVYFLAVYISGKTVEGWTTIVISLWGFGGLQILSIGLVGEYIGKIYMESKNRPKYFVEEYLTGK